MKVSSAEIRESFLDYFSTRDHLVIGSSSLVPHDDPTLLVINSGMAPLKSYFIGEKSPPHKRLCNIQKCIRTNDIECVGDRHHLTFFEMMGNWSIDDYSKEEAIRLAWILIGEVFGFDTSRIYVTVYGGDQRWPNVPPDEETHRVWETLLPTDRIVHLNADSNFWGPAGITGPCGPCTEVFFDQGESFGCGKTTCGPDCECGRFLEIWNAGVFMQYYLHDDGKLTELPFKSVDAGAGLERFAVILQGVDTVYETDLLKPIMEVITSQSALQSDSRSTRIIIDHIRCSIFMIADGIYPSNLGREYVLRKILRRALLHSRLTEVTLNTLKMAVATVRICFSQYYPELENAEETVEKTLDQEAYLFDKTLSRGLREFDKIVERSHNTISGSDAFKLHETLGFPLELTKELAQTKGLSVDEEEFKAKFEEHRRRSRPPLRERQPE